MIQFLLDYCTFVHQYFFMSKYFQIGLLLCITSFCYSQSDSLKQFIDKKTYARQEVLTLQKEGAVIVILKGKTRAMEAYEKAGKTAIVEEMSKKIAKTNRALMQAFNHYWDFCPVFYLYNDDIATFQKNNGASVFIDSMLKMSTNISFHRTYHVYIDFGSYYVPSSNTSDMKRSKTNAQPQVKVADPSESSQTVEECLVVKDKDLNQFISPYPNRSVSIMGSRDMNNLVAALNRRFYAFIDDK